MTASHSHSTWSDLDEDFFIRNIGRFSDVCKRIEKIVLLNNYLQALSKREMNSGIDISRARTLAMLEIAKETNKRK